MEWRITMNSASLQKLFPKEYEEFFAKCNLVVSCPQVINRWNITHLDDIKQKVVQKLPTKLYIGANIREDGKIKLISLTQFNTIEKKFETTDVETNGNHKMIEKMEKEIKERLMALWCEKGVEIYVLSENARDTGPATSSMEAMLISFLIHIVTGKIKVEDIDDFEKFIKMKECKGIYTIAKEMIANIAHIDKKNINGTILFTTTINNGNVGLWFANKEFIEQNYPKVIHCENSICLEHTGLNPRKIIDYAIINFGNCFNEFYGTELYFKAKEEYENILKIYNEPVTTEKEALFTNTINFLYLNFIQAAKQATYYYTDENIMNHFFDTIAKLSRYQAFIEWHIDLHRTIIQSFQENKLLEDERIGLLPISSVKPGGTLICLLKYSKSRETIKKMIQTLHDKWYKTANLSYLSREDGISEEHLEIEQYLDKGRFSKYINEGDVITECYGNDCGKRIIGNHREIIEEITDGIVFDCIDGKIYINGELTNHNEILTQSGTVDSMKILLEHIGTYVNNSQLPVSSYTKNKNEMVGKIIGPLQELAKKRFNEKIDLECTGNIVDFDLRIKPGSIKLYLIKKI